jgi:hypothetical protein
MSTDKALARIHAQLQNAIHGRREIVDGVEIDLRHELVPPRDWRPKLSLTFGATPEPPWRAPFIWFPWFGPYDENAVTRQAQAAMAAQPRTLTSERAEGQERGDQNIRAPRETSQTSEASIESYFQAHTPECVVQKGDKISIDRVEIVRIGDDFDHIHDLEVRNAYLRITHANGEIDKLKTPITFSGRTAVLDDDISNTSVYDIKYRIERHFKLKSVRDMNLVQADDSYAYRALRKAYSVDIATEGLWSKSTNGVVVVVGRGPSEEFHDGSNTWYTVNDAVMMGYLWGRAEAAELMMPHAKSALVAKSESARHGKRGGEKRRKRAQEGWKRIAEKIIDELWQVNPSLTQADVVRRIPDKWAKASSALGLSIPAPSDGSLKPLVSQLKNNAILPSSPPKNNEGVR